MSKVRYKDAVETKIEQKGAIMLKGNVKPEKTTNWQRKRLASPLLRIVKAAFEDPKIQAEFEQWLEARKLKSDPVDT